MSRGSKPLSLFVSRRPTISRTLTFSLVPPPFLHSFHRALLPPPPPPFSTFVLPLSRFLSSSLLALFSSSPPSLPSSPISSLIHSRHRASSSLSLSLPLPITHPPPPPPCSPHSRSLLFHLRKRLVPSFSLRDFHNPRSLFFSRTRPIGVSLSRP